MYEFDIAKRRYTSTRRTYHMDDPTFLLSDLTALDRHHLAALKRDNTMGAATVHKQGFVIDLRRTDAAGTLVKRQVLDLEHPARPGADLAARPPRRRRPRRSVRDAVRDDRGGPAAD